MTHHKDSVKTVVLCGELNHLGQGIFFHYYFLKEKNNRKVASQKA